MKFLLLFLFIISALTFNTYSQFSSPESVVYDSVYNRWLVTNSTGVIKQRTADGNVTDFAPAGSGTHGIRIYNGTAYTCMGQTIKGFQLSNGSQVFSVTLSGASFLNGMGISNSGIAYISDFTGQKIYKLNLNTQAWWVYVTAAGGQPNGVYVDQPRNRLLVCYWGSNAPVKQVSLADSSVTTLTNTGYSNCDGIYADKYDNIYISSWSPSPAKILRYDINFTLPVAIVVNSGLSNPADIFIKKSGDTLAVPNSGSNQLTFHNIGNIAGVTALNTGIPGSFKLYQNYPNPFNPETKIKFDLPEGSGYTTLNLYSVTGELVKELLSSNLKPGSYVYTISADELPSGTYFYRLSSGILFETGKLTLVK